MDLLFAMAAVISTWAVITTMLIGLGLGVLCLLRFREPTERVILHAFWLGFSVILLFLQLWHFQWRINAGPWIVGSILALPGLWVFRHLLASIIIDTISRRPLRVLLMILGVIWLANRSIGPCQAFNSGYYNIPAVRWFTSYPTVPGLGNLHDRLAFNNSSLLFDAMLDQGFWSGRSNHLANGLLVAALLVQVIWSCARLFSRDTPMCVGDWFDAFLLLPVFHLATDVEFLNISSITPEPAVSIMMFVAGSQLFRMLTGTSKNPAFDGFFVVTIVAAALTVKLNALAFAIVASSLVLWIWYVRPERADPSNSSLRHAVYSSVLAGVLLIGPWMARGIVLSGYPAYPSTLGGVNVDWRVPEEMAVAQSRLVRDEARYYYDYDPKQPPKISWIGPWIRHSLSAAKGELILPGGLIVCAMVLVIGSYKANVPGAFDRAGWLAVIPGLALLIQCFVLGPNPRFMFAGSWVVAAVVLTGALAPIASRSSLLQRTIILSIVLVAGLFISARAFDRLLGHSPTKALGILFYVPGPDHGFYPLPVAKLVPFTTSSGLVIMDPTEDGRIWDGPLLSTPYPDKRLELRIHDQLRYGFRMASVRSSNTH